MSRELLMLFLVLASVLGGIMGACLWSLRGQGDDDSGERAAKPDAPRAKPPWQPEPVDRHAQAQSRRIASLVAELQAAEEQQMRLQRDLATLRASRQHGGESIHPRLLDQGDDLPVLNRRVAGAGDRQGRSQPRAATARQRGSGSELLGLSLALDSTAEIPVLSEEELADSIDDLDLEIIGEGGRNTRHG